MRLTIIPSDDIVIVDDEGKEVDCTQFSELEGLNAVQWNGTTGWIEFDNRDSTPYTFKCNEPIESVDAYQDVIDAWEAAESMKAPVPPKLLKRPEPTDG
jgi:hypothetical protein